MPSPKLLYAILALAVLTIFGGVGYLASKSQTKQSSTPATLTPVQTIQPPIPKSIDNSSVKDSSTADWQTYENKEFRFSFKYPKDWKLNEEFVKNNGVTFYSKTVTSPERKTDATEIRGFDFDVRIYPSINGLPNNASSQYRSFKQWLDGNTGELGYINHAVHSLVGNQPAYRGNSVGVDTNPLYLLEYGNFVFEIRPYAEDEIGKKAIGNQILSTFKPTK